VECRRISTPSLSRSVTNGELAIALETVRGIDQFSVHSPGKRRARRPGPIA